MLFSSIMHDTFRYDLKLYTLFVSRHIFVQTYTALILLFINKKSSCARLLDLRKHYYFTKRLSTKVLLLRSRRATFTHELRRNWLSKVNIRAISAKLTYGGQNKFLFCCTIFLRSVPHIMDINVCTLYKVCQH